MPRVYYTWIECTYKVNSRVRGRSIHTYSNQHRTRNSVHSDRREHQPAATGAHNSGVSRIHAISFLNTSRTPMAAFAEASTKRAFCREAKAEPSLVETCPGILSAVEQRDGECK
ncbi:hypothetical protein CY34DRAFT_655409 [Suillus luteus UH-Slu-Lm8-n1]|uniref:Uncharacterized protein n=1 Tax=Suillus luteus UH-Slu-Lm8-n1 TaxID=930992 RepID=A0A0D0A7T1_9AGAM|nr:hypothetical protein CY34DRAFT_655409 [Suillus luteus UH-Slu-Lm8-n1]